MNVRGAPLIAIVAVLGLGCDMSAQGAAGAFATLGQADAWLREAADYLRTSRPTAVNLFTAMDQVVALAGKVRVSSVFESAGCGARMWYYGVNTQTQSVCVC
jgi:methylthioribose-1-phosphate isomerase